MLTETLVAMPYETFHILALVDNFVDNPEDIKRKEKIERFAQMMKQAQICGTPFVEICKD